jgi:hypothetical protein
LAPVSLSSADTSPSSDHTPRESPSSASEIKASTPLPFGGKADASDKETKQGVKEEKFVGESDAGFIESKLRTYFSTFALLHICPPTSSFVPFSFQLYFLLPFFVHIILHMPSHPPFYPLFNPPPPLLLLLLASAKNGRQLPASVGNDINWTEVWCIRFDGLLVGACGWALDPVYALFRVVL